MSRRGTGDLDKEFYFVFDNSRLFLAVIALQKFLQSKKKSSFAASSWKLIYGTSMIIY